MSGGAWDARLFVRSAAIAAVAAAVTLLVVAATDEGGPLARRLGMTAALSPVAGALGALITIRGAAARGELRALAAIGVDPGRAVRGAVMGGVAIGLAGAIAAASPWVDLEALFPRPIEARTWVADGDGLLEPALGLRVDARGELSLVPPTRPTAGPLPPWSTSITALMIALTAIAAPVWVATSVPPWRRASSGILALLAAVVAFQGVAAGRFDVWVLPAAPLILLIDGAIARYRERTS